MSVTLWRGRWTQTRPSLYRYVHYVCYVCPYTQTRSQMLHLSCVCSGWWCRQWIEWQWPHHLRHHWWRCRQPVADWFHNGNNHSHSGRGLWEHTRQPGIVSMSMRRACQLLTFLLHVVSLALTLVTCWCCLLSFAATFWLYKPAMDPGQPQPQSALLSLWVAEWQVCPLEATDTFSKHDLLSGGAIWLVKWGLCLSCFQDTNDHNPYFGESLYEQSISEDTPPGTEVETVTALDEDASSSPNGQIEYRIESGSQDKFEIAAQTGVITVAPGATFDREAQELYTLNVSTWCIVLRNCTHSTWVHGA